MKTREKTEKKRMKTNTLKFMFIVAVLFVIFLTFFYSVNFVQAEPPPPSPKDEGGLRNFFRDVWSDLFSPKAEKSVQLLKQPQPKPKYRTRFDNLPKPPKPTSPPFNPPAPSGPISWNSRDYERFVQKYIDLAERDKANFENKAWDEFYNDVLAAGEANPLDEQREDEFWCIDTCHQEEGFVYANGGGRPIREIHNDDPNVGLRENPGAVKHILSLSAPCYGDPGRRGIPEPKLTRESKWDAIKDMLNWPFQGFFFGVKSLKEVHDELFGPSFSKDVRDIIVTPFRAVGEGLKYIGDGGGIVRDAATTEAENLLNDVSNRIRWGPKEEKAMNERQKIREYMLKNNIKENPILNDYYNPPGDSK